MCSGTDSFDIALAAEEVDICQAPFVGIQQARCGAMDYNRGLAFHDYQIVTDPMVYEFSDIDATEEHTKTKQFNDFFTLFDFNAKWDIIPTMLTQSHERVIPGFMGQTTAFRKQFIRSDVTSWGTKSTRSAKYIHGTQGRAMDVYGGHDPEDYRHLVNDPPT